MSAEVKLLLITAGSIGLVHTLLGPDHYLPFIVMSRARRWSLARTAAITAACGLGHVLSSVVIGLVGVAAGILVSRLEYLESVRGEVAAWGLIAFGLVYGVWGLRRAVRNRPHGHRHVHLGGTDSAQAHEHEHVHDHSHAHPHDQQVGANITPWILLTIFVLGPCEPLIPLLMYPAAQHSIVGLVMVTTVFGVVTVATMMGVVLVVSRGIATIPLGGLERYTHALAGAIIFVSGMAIRFLGL